MKNCTCCLHSKPLSEFFFVAAKGKHDTFCKVCRRQAVMDSHVKNRERNRRLKAVKYDGKRAREYASKPPVVLARTMAVIVSAVQVWRDHDPAKFTEFKNLMKERIAP